MLMTAGFSPTVGPTKTAPGKMKKTEGHDLRGRGRNKNTYPPPSSGRSRQNKVFSRRSGRNRKQAWSSSPARPRLFPSKRRPSNRVLVPSERNDDPTSVPTSVTSFGWGQSTWAPSPLSSLPFAAHYLSMMQASPALSCKECLYYKLRNNAC